MRHLFLITLTLAGALCAAPRPAQAGTLDAVREVIRAGDRDRAISRLLTLDPTTTDASERTQARFLLGRLLTEIGSPVGLGYLEALPAPMPRVDDRRLVWLARAQMLMGPSAEAAKALQVALKHAKGDVERTELQLMLAAVEDALGRGAEAAQVLSQIAEGDGPRHLRASACRLWGAWCPRSRSGARARGIHRIIMMQNPI